MKEILCAVDDTVREHGEINREHQVSKVNGPAVDTARAPRVGFLMQDVRALYGTERVTLALLRALRAKGIDTAGLVMHETRLGADAGPLQKALEDAGIPVTRFNVGRPFSPALIRSLRETVRRERLDLVHVTGYKGHLHATLAAACPVVTTVHGWLFRPDVKERFYGWVDLQCMKRDAAVICLSSFYEHYVRERGVPEAILRRIATGIDLAEFPSADEAAAAAPTGGFVVGILGRLSYEKNHAMFLRAARRMLDRLPDVRFVIAGDGPERASIERQVERLGLSERVELRGYTESRAFFRAVHALVLCSNVENFPYSILEAMAWCRPVVATRAGGIPDLVVDGATGFLVAKNDDAALAASVVRLIEDPALARRMGRAGRDRAEREFALAASVERHVELYTGLVEKRRASLGGP